MFIRGVSADGGKFENIRAFSLPPNFATFASDEKVNYLASLLEGLARGTAEQFSVVHQRIASQQPALLPPSPAPRTQVRSSVKALMSV